MSEVNTLPPELEMPLNGIPWEERLEDHKNKIEEYLQNCIFRGCNVESTLYERKVVLQSIFRRVDINDSTHPKGHRHLLVWELLSPSLGSRYLSLIISSLVNDDTALGTRRKYMNSLRYFCEYVLAKPHIPGSNGLSIPDKYGPIAVPFTKYDLPIHAADRPRRKRYALSPDLRDDFFEFLRIEYLPNHSLPHVGARNYTAIILQAEIGARSSELLGLRSGGESCDVDRLKGRVRLLGKGKAYSGKRLRWVPLTPLAAEVLNTFQRVFKPMFPKSPHSDYLFLNEDGRRLTKFWYWKIFRKIIVLARNSGVQVPENLRPHDLRRTFATNELQKNPLAYRKVLKHLGHSYPSSAAPYLIATDEDVEEEQGDLIDIFVDPHVDKWGKS
jgi:integrase